jgi:hypothetical protein
MPSSGDLKQESRGGPERIRNEELWRITLTDSLRSEIRRLTVHRQSAYDRAQAHRQNGQLVPASLCEEMAENGSRLRWALDRYTEATGRR